MNVVDSLNAVEAQEVASVDVDANFLPRSPMTNRMPQSSDEQSTRLEESSRSPAHSDCSNGVEYKTSVQINNSTTSVASKHVKISRASWVPRSDVTQNSRTTRVVCTICSSTLCNLDSLINHIRLIHGQFACRKCDGTFQSADDLATHIQADHTTIVSIVDLPYVCHICDRSFHTSTSLHKHMSLSHNANDKPHLCDLCGASFCSEKSLRKHFKGHELPQRCERCGDRFRHNYELREHLLACLTGIRKPFKCDTCGVCFKHRRTLRCHEQAHTGRTVCHICGRSYGHKASLEKHRLFCHQLTARKCPECGKVFSNPSYFKRHMDMHEKMKANANSLSCSVCSRSFQTEMKLAKHAVDHMELKGDMVQCGTCSKQFKNRQYLKAHVATHSQVKLSCPVPGCSKQFTIRSNAVRHTKKAHRMSREEFDAALRHQTAVNEENQDYWGNTDCGNVSARAVVERTVEVSSMK